MKKRLAMVFGAIATLALLVTGCATVSNVKNDTRELIYYGGSAVSVSDYTYFANAYTPYESETEYDYGANAKTSYLARIQKSQVRTYGKDFSPSTVDKVNDIVTGYQNQDMFVLGDYIYFTSMNTHQYADLEHKYSLVTFYRSRLNGDDLHEIYTTEYYSGGKFAPVGDLQNGYYWVVYTGAYTSESSFSGQIFSIKLQDRIGGANMIADRVLSASFANVNEDGNVDRVFYTRSQENGKNSICSVDYDGKNKIAYDNNGKDLSLIDKVEDRVIYTVGGNSNYSCYTDVAGLGEGQLFIKDNKFAYNTSLTDARLVSADDSDRGYVYQSGNSISYRRASSNGLTEVLVSTSDTLTMLFVDGDRVYYQSGNAIYRISVKGQDPQPEQIVSMTSMVSGQYGFDGQYIYFFAALEDVETKEDVEDTGNYMYRVEKWGGDYQLIGKTATGRTPK